MLLALGSGCEEQRRPTPPVPTESDTPGEPQESAQPSATLRSEAAQAMASAPSRTMRAIIAFVRFRDDDIVESGCMTRAKEAWRDPDVLPTVAHQLLSSSPKPPFADSTLTAYFYQQSRGRFVLHGGSYPRVIVTEKDESAYRSGSSRVLDRGAITQEVLRRMDEDSAFDLSEFDADGDGRIDYLFILLRRISDVQLVAGGAPAVAALGYNPSRPEFGKSAPVASPPAGSFLIYRSAGIIIPHLDLVRLMAHEFGHTLWRGTPIGGGHLPFVGGDHGVPANGSRRLGYALMVGRLTMQKDRDVIDTRGDMLISAVERDMLDEDWIECPVLSGSGTVTLGDLYATSDCRRIVLPGPTEERTLYITNRQRIGYFDRLQFNPCQGSYHGLMETGLLVQLREGKRAAVIAADNTLELSIDTSAYAGDLFGPGSMTQLTPWTRPNISGFAQYPPDFVLQEGNWQALDDIRMTGGSSGEMAFDYIVDVRERPVIREDSWMGAETSGTRFRSNILVMDGARLTIEAGTEIHLAEGADLIVSGEGTLAFEREARVVLGPGSSVENRGTILLPDGEDAHFVRSDG